MPLSDNSSKWSANSSIIGSPNFWLLVYDPVIPAQQVYTSGTAGLSLINANGVNTVTLSPTYVQRRDSPPHYEYNAIVSTSPNLNIVCDVATRNMSPGATSNVYTDCTAFILFRFGNLDRTTINERPAMEWADVVASIGSYFALVQFVCWVISGLAWTSIDTEPEVPESAGAAERPSESCKRTECV